MSYQLQEMVADLWSDASVVQTLTAAAQVYAGRGAALRSALAAHGITASGRSGFTCWVPVADEDGVATALARGDASPKPPREGIAAAGWAVAPGQRFRIAAPPGVRISLRPSLAGGRGAGSDQARPGAAAPGIAPERSAALTLWLGGRPAVLPHFRERPPGPAGYLSA